jgi:hypothetical protein
MARKAVPPAGALAAVTRFRARAETYGGQRGNKEHGDSFSQDSDLFNHHHHHLLDAHLNKEFLLEQISYLKT